MEFGIEKHADNENGEKRNNGGNTVRKAGKHQKKKKNY